ncbi:hypothetical protein [Legionella cardiaca]|uniref:Interaptin n=1 Tax=Legionella cardiaca TaxID=1071983 RepID=A0ABY8AT67_9GAMM|nr:hypothetical protein [Legionella cardiaca]WED42337.1 hypothetical protein PXX05_10445 [Legionella cardiaca]
MPAVNNTLKAALLRDDIATKPGAIEALNDLLKLNYTDPTTFDAFRQAILNKPTFWQGLGFDPTGQPNNNTWLHPDGDIGSGNNPLYSYETLYKLAAEKRIMIGLAGRSEAELQSLLSPNPPATVLSTTDIRNKLVTSATQQPPAGRVRVGQPTVTLPGWDPATQTVLTDAAVGNIQKEAQRLLILKKLEAANASHINHIQALLTAGDDATFRAALGNLGVSANLVQGMNHADLFPLVKVAAAKKGFELHLAANPIANFNQAYNHLKDNNKARFATNVVPAPYQAHLQADSESDWVREVYGKKYLEEFYAREVRDVNMLSTIAKQSDVAAQKHYLTTTGGHDALYVNAAVTDKNLPALRQAAAIQALKLKIANLEDLETLDALLKVTRPDDIKRILDRSDSLGYKNDTAFQDAFTDAKSVREIIAAAMVRKAIYTADDPAKLKAMLLDPTPTFSTVWDRFAPPNPVISGSHVANYFKDPANVSHAKAEALIRLAKITLKEADDAEIAKMALAATPGELQKSVRTLLGSDENTAQPTDALITNITYKLEQSLKAHAAIEATLRATKDIDLDSGTNFANFIGRINTLNITRPTTINGAAGRVGGSTLASLSVSALIANPNLSAKEREEFRGRLVENLVRNYPAPPTGDPQKLNNLTQAKNFTTFKQALTALGITEQGWVTKESMTAVQTAASKQAIQRNLGNYSSFASHNAFNEMVEKLPLAKQQAMVENPDITRSLRDAQTPEAIQRVLGSDIKIDPALLSNLAKENQHHGFAAKIINPEVARLVGNLRLSPPAKLDETSVRTINNLILGANPFSGPNYQRTVTAIAQALHLPDHALDVTFDTARGPLANITTQHTRNADLITEYNRTISPPLPTQSDKAILEFLMTLNKDGGAPFPQGDINSAKDAFRNAKTPQELIQTLANIPTGGGVFTADSLKRQITPEVFYAAKIESNKAILSSNNKTEVSAALTDQKAARQDVVDLHKEITSGDKAIYAKLKDLSTTTSMNWLNPGFQASARQYSREMLATYRELDKVCNTTIEFFENEIALLERQKASLPPTTGMTPDCKKLIDAERVEITKQLAAAKEELARYQGVQKLLRGTPGAPEDASFADKGVLRVLEEAEKGKDIRFTGIASEIEDYPISQKASLLKVKGTDTIDLTTANALRASTSGPVRFTTEKPIPPGHIRNHTVSYNVDVPAARGVAASTQQVHSRYLEERGPDVARVDKNGKVFYTATTTITNREAPPKGKDKGHWMSMAADLLKSCSVVPGQPLPGGKPGEVQKIYLSHGVSKEEAKQLCMALLVLGREVPDFKFDSSAIDSTDTGFDVRSLVNDDRRFKSLRQEKILDEQEYQAWLKDPAVDQALKGMKAFAEVKHGKQAVQDQKKMTTTAIDTTQHYKKEVSEGRLTKMEESNKEVQKTIPTLGSGGGG